MMQTHAQTEKKKISAKKDSWMQDVHNLKSSSGFFKAVVQGKGSMPSSYQLSLEGEEIQALYTLSCAFEPQAQDEVLVVQDDTGRYLILSIIQRHSEEPLVLLSEKTLILNAANIAFVAKDKLSFQSKETYSHSELARHYADKLEVVSDRSEFLSKKTNVVSHQVSTTFDLFTSKVNTLMERLGFVTRTVEKFESNNIHAKQEKIQHQLVLSAGSARISAKDNLQISSRQIFMN